MKRASITLLSLLLTLPVFGQIDWNAGVVYEYDGSGNVTKIGNDTYVYDTAQRLIRGSVAGSQQSYTYDSFGNRTGCAGGGDCQYGVTIDSATNRINVSNQNDYDQRGNLRKLPEGNILDYDALGMVQKESGNGRTAYYIYTADDERIAVYEADTALNAHTWRWTVRSMDKKPLREFTSQGTSGTTNFQWTKDYIWREGALFASRQLDPAAPGGVSTYHYHTDHLGSPRLVTNTSGVIIGRHDYLPFGPEVANNPTEPQQQNVKFTGHERDFARDRAPLDYMHARYYDGRVGRFLSVDPVLGRTLSPQSWNRYSYAHNNPLLFVDPSGNYALPNSRMFGDPRCERLCSDGPTAHGDGSQSQPPKETDEILWEQTFGQLHPDKIKEAWKALEEDPIVIDPKGRPVETWMNVVVIASWIDPGPGDEVAATGAWRVYRAFNADGSVAYIGITKDLQRRAAEHLRLKGMEIFPIEGLSNLSYGVARAAENVLIQHHGGPGVLRNKIYSIAAKRLGLYQKEITYANTLLKSLGYLP